jgi:hypothetical protein
MDRNETGAQGLAEEEPDAEHPSKSEVMALAPRRIAVTCRRSSSHSFVQTPDR